MINQMPINTSRFNNPQCSTKSAFDKNLNASANSTKAKTFFTVSSQPPLFGKDFNQLGKMANNANGNANAVPKPAMPAVSDHAPSDAVPTSNVPSITPVQEKETITRVSAIKKMPLTLVKPLLASTLPAMPEGRVISKYPKKEMAKNMNTTKKKIFNHALVEILLNISGCTFPIR